MNRNSNVTKNKEMSRQLLSLSINNSNMNPLSNVTNCSTIKTRPDNTETKGGNNQIFRYYSPKMRSFPFIQSKKRVSSKNSFHLSKDYESFSKIKEDFFNSNRQNNYTKNKNKNNKNKIPIAQNPKILHNSINSNIEIKSIHKIYPNKYLTEKTSYKDYLSDNFTEEEKKLIDHIKNKLLQLLKLSNQPQRIIQFFENLLKKYKTYANDTVSLSIEKSHSKTKSNSTEKAKNISKEKEKTKDHSINHSKKKTKENSRNTPHTILKPYGLKKNASSKSKDSLTNINIFGSNLINTSSSNNYQFKSNQSESCLHLNQPNIITSIEKLPHSKSKVKEYNLELDNHNNNKLNKEHKSEKDVISTKNKSKLSMKEAQLNLTLIPKVNSNENNLNNINNNNNGNFSSGSGSGSAKWKDKVKDFKIDFSSIKHYERRDFNDEFLKHQDEFSPSWRKDVEKMKQRRQEYEEDQT